MTRPLATPVVPESGWSSGDFLGTLDGDSTGRYPRLITGGNRLPTGSRTIEGSNGTGIDTFFGTQSSVLLSTLDGCVGVDLSVPILRYPGLSQTTWKGSRRTGLYSGGKSYTTLTEVREVVGQPFRIDRKSTRISTTLFSHLEGGTFLSSGPLIHLCVLWSFSVSL